MTLSTAERVERLVVATAILSMLGLVGFVIHRHMDAPPTEPAASRVPTPPRAHRRSGRSGASNPAAEWCRGGTLHRATVREWKSATSSNKLATAADWLAATKWEGHLNTPDDFRRMRTRALTLVTAVDESVRGSDVWSDSNVAEISAALLTLSDDLGP